MTWIAVTLLALIAALPALAGQEADCMTGRDGKARIPRGDALFCPSEYFLTDSGRCCQAFRADAPRAIPKVQGKACPSGSFTSGGDWCLSFGR